MFISVSHAILRYLHSLEFQIKWKQLWAKVDFSEDYRQIIHILNK